MLRFALQVATRLALIDFSLIFTTALKSEMFLLSEIGDIIVQYIIV